MYEHLNKLRHPTNNKLKLPSVNQSQQTLKTRNITKGKDGVYMIRLVFFICLSTLLIAGCQNTPPTNQSDNSSLINVNQTTPEQDDQLDNQTISKRLVEIASSVPDVNHATAVVTSPFAVVGIDVNEKVDRARVGTIKYTVTEALQKDRYGKKAIVTADPDLVYRIQQMSKKVQNGQPVSGIMEELSSIVNRIMPEAPRPSQTQNPQPQENVNQQLENDEQKQLQEDQKKQDTESE